MIFWDSVDTKWNHDGSPNKLDCWEWKSKKGTGKRAYTRYKGKGWIASRLAWELYYGNIPDGMCVCHKCDNPPCCNPFHLFLGTVQDNVDDREQKGRNKIPLSRGEAHGLHKVTSNQVLEIRQLYNTTDHTYRSLAKVFGISFGEVRNIIQRKNWGWL